MGVFKKIFGIFKKLGKLFSGGKKGGDQDDRLPGERRIGIYGPSNVGKSVFFTMLYKACRQDREFNLSPDDPSTGKQLVTNLNTLRSGEWLPGTVEESELNFKASLKGGSQFPFSTRDYKGETVDLEEEGSAKENLVEYFRSCDAILFLLSPEMIADARKCEREIMSFTAMINQVTDSGGRGLRIPIGLVVTKADAIDGFENDKQDTLVDRKSEYLKAKSFEDFVEGVCGQYHIAKNIVFQENVRDTMKRLSLFFDFLMTLSMDFQVFFISSVGHVQQVEASDGTTSSRPPEDPDGIGVKTPFLWVIETIKRRERIAAINGMRRFVFRFALVILIFYSVFYGLHLFRSGPTLQTMQSAEEDYASEAIQESLNKEANRWVVKHFSFFALPGANAARIEERAAQLDASYQAHRYLAESLPKLTGDAAIRTLATSYKTPDWLRAEPWYSNLLGSLQQLVDEAVWGRVRVHNLAVAEDIRRLEEDNPNPADGAATAIQDRCAQLSTGFVVPQVGREDYDRLVADAGEVCARIGLAGQERSLLDQWDQIRRELDRISDYPAPLSDDIAKLRTAASDFERDARSSDSETIREKADVAQSLYNQLTNMQLVLTPGNESEAGRILGQMRQSSGVIEPLSRWAVRHQRNVASGKNAAGVEKVREDVAAQMSATPSLGWILSPDLQGKISRLRLSGAKKTELDTFLANLQALRDSGEMLDMNVVQVPQGFVVVAQDPKTEEWGRSQAAAGHSIRVHWVAGLPLRIGIQKAGASATEPCSSAPAYIHEVDNRIEAIRCPGTSGAQTQVSFVGLDALLRTQLLEPLTAALAE